MPGLIDSSDQPPTLDGLIEGLNNDVEYLMRKRNNKGWVDTPILYEIAWAMPGVPYATTFPPLVTPMSCRATEAVVTARVADTGNITWQLLRNGSAVYTGTFASGLTFYRYTRYAGSFPADANNALYSEPDQTTWTIAITAAGNGAGQDMAFALRFT